MSIFTFPEVFNPVNANGTVRGPNLAEAHVTIKELMSAAQMALFDGNIYTTRAALYADLAHAANSWALVIGDPTSGYDGLYRKSGSSGSGSWSRIGDVPGSGFISGSDTGAGTANAIQVTSPTIPAANGAALISFNIFEVNTSSPVTVSFNGATALTIKDNAGSDVQAGALKAGMIVTGYKSGSTFRLINIFDGEFLLATNVSGTNAIVATTPTPIPATAGAALIALPISIANTSSPVTVAFNGGSALTIKDSSGNDIQAGTLKVGAIVAGYISGSTFQLSQSFGTQFVTGADAGAGTANAIQVTTATPFSQADGDALISFAAFEANTSSPVTVAFNGGTALTIKSNSGADIAANGLVAGITILGVKIGSTFRLLSDHSSASNLAAAEAAQAAAELAQAAAEAAAASVVPRDFNTIAEAEAATVNSLVNYIYIEGNSYRRVDYFHPRLGPELIDNGDFGTDSIWGKSGIAVISGGVGSKAAGGDGGYLQSIPLEEGIKYLITNDFPTLSGGAPFLYLTGGTDVYGTSRTIPGTHNEVLEAETGNDALGIYGNSAAGFTIDNVSVKALPADAIQTADGAWWARDALLLRETIASYRPGKAPDAFTMDGYWTAGDGGAGKKWRKKAAIEADAPADFTLTLADGVTTVRYGYAEKVADVQALGAIGNFAPAGVSSDDADAHDDTDAFELAAEVAAHYGFPGIYIGYGDYKITRTIPIVNRFAIWGPGPAGVHVHTVDLNGPIFDLIVPDDSGSMDYSLCHGIEFRAVWTEEPLDWEDCSVFRVSEVGSATDKFFQWSHFYNLRVAGFHQFFDVTLPARTTGFGLECNVTWCTFADMEFRAWAHYARYGFNFRTGSGTGNQFVNLKGFFGGPHYAGTNVGAVARFSGVGHVVGDVVVTGGHFGSYVAGSSVIQIGDSTVYRSRCSVVSAQIDAGMDYVFDASSVGSVPYTDMRAVGCNIGGIADVWHGPPLQSGQLHEKAVSDVRSGKWVSTSSTGAQTINIFKVTVLQFTATIVKVRAAGFIGGVGGGAIEQAFAVVGEAVSATVVAGTDVSNPASPNITISTSISGYEVTFRVEFTPSSAGSSIDTQIEGSAGWFKIDIL